MCGIITLIGHKSKVTEKNTDEALEVMKHRGKDDRDKETINDDSGRRAILCLLYTSPSPRDRG